MKGDVLGQEFITVGGQERVCIDFPALLARYRRELLGSVVPFWLQHAVDREHGGLLTCISDEGQVLSTDKYMWSQLRALWTFSALYNRIEPRPEWLDVAWRTYEFARRHGRDESGCWVFATTREGRVLQGATSIYSDGFALYGLTELARATGDAGVVELARDTYANVQRRLARPGSYGVAPFDVPHGAKAHAISMIFSLVFAELGHYLGDAAIVEAGLHHAREVLDAFLRPEKKLLYEFMGLDNVPLDTPQGRSVVPGHAIEAMWFMIHIFRRAGDAARVAQAVEAIRWHLEFGWDDEYGGLYHARDASGGEPWWRFADAKLWWPHTEALYALLLAYEETGAQWCLDWYARVHDYAFGHYPAPGHGEWRQKLDRYGKPITETVALPVKDPFHLPRALLLGIEALELLVAAAQPVEVRERGEPSALAYNARPPNLLFLITDQQQAASVEPGSPCHTPHLDRLAASGTQFTRCYAPSPICSPTRASLFTGLYPHSHGMVDTTHAVEPYRAELKEGLPFWPRALRAAGYRTAYLGKWHVERSERLERFGFDEYDVARYGQLLGLVERDAAGMAQRRVVQHKGYRDFLVSGIVDDPPESTPEYRIYSDGIRFLERAASEPDRPWALMLSTEAPHDPYVALRACYERYDPAALPRPPSFDDDLAGRPAIYRRLQAVWRDLDWDDFARATACYYANISLIDDQVGRILHALETLGQAENTLVVFTSDHGDYMGAHRLLLKGVAAFDEAYRVPLILCGPGVPQSRCVADVVSLLGLPPALVARTAGIEFPCQALSLLPLLLPQPANWPSEAYAEMQGQRFAYQQRLLWQGPWKYVFNTFDEDELYDLATDPHEKHNLAADPAHRPVLERMAARMWQIIRAAGDTNMLGAQYGMFRFAPVGPECGERV
ncbi:MAG: sulfatase-like hydrolase/transferase [Anaerolineae bacterium]